MQAAIAGRFDGRTHILPVRIYYADTDLSGVVYHANYLAYMERGRSEFFRAAGIARLAQMEEPEPTAWTLRRVTLDYLRPARVDDLLEVHTRLTGLTGARMNAEQDVYLDGQMLTRGAIEACVITLTGKPRRIPQDVRDKLAPFLYETVT
ncbi:MAG TPA: YbgC/FadM family acyl-CoA thioesterase [Rhizomicrobium sp.]|nr:YbgC/FadM family acyl-CoA thioesterase [Rhizomicrobium sp.]